MKRFFATLFIAVLLLSMIPATVFADNAEERVGIQNQWTETEGVTHPVGAYFTEKRLEKMPVTIEAWVYLPQDLYLQPYGTVISNFPHKKEACFTFSIEARGVPQLTFGGQNSDQTYAFTNVFITPDTWTHVVIVYHEEAKQILCYLNGELKGSTVTSAWVPAPEGVLDNTLCIMGDRDTMNTRGFHGTLGDVTVYADVRTQEEIAQDASAPALQDPDLLLHYDMKIATYGTDIPDASGNGYNMRYERMWLTQEEWDALLAEDDKEYTYSIAFLPDIQYTTRYYPEKLGKPFDYLLENKQSKNIQYLITLGDLTDNNTNNEWTDFVAQTNRLDGALPYSLIQGNHDALKNNASPFYDHIYGKPAASYYQHVKTNGGFYQENSTKNTYLLFSVGEVDYLILNLDFGASDDVLTWADGVLSQYANRRVIAVTHSYIKVDGTLTTDGEYGAPSTYLPTMNDGDDMWNKLFSKHANVSMIVCGHYTQDALVHSLAVGENGNTVHQLLMDVQYSDKLIKSAGVVSLMHFTEDGRYARVEFYSTTQEKYFKESVSWLKLDFGEWDGAKTSNEAPDLLPIILISAGVLVVAGVVITILLVVKKKKVQKQEDGSLS